MEYQIFGGAYPAVEVRLQRGEAMYTQAGGMAWMNDQLTMTTQTKGVGKGILRSLFAGESLFMNTYTADSDSASITFAAKLPGSIKALEIGSREYVIQKGAFLCATPGVSLELAFNKNVGAGFFGGEGFVMQRLKGNGLAFLEVDGALKEIDLQPGETLKISTGNIAAFESSVSYTAEVVKGVKNIFFGGEGIFLSVLRGPGKVWLQTMSAQDLASAIIPFLPASHNSNN